MSQTETNILLLDDEPNVLRSLERLLRPHGYQVRSALNAAEALALVQEQEPDIVITDYNLPDMTGVDFLEKVQKGYPNIVQILLTGDQGPAAIQAINRSRVYRFISKPWDNEDLKLTVRQALYQADLERQNAQLLETVNKQNRELRSVNENLERKVEERTAAVKQLYANVQSQFVKSVRVFIGLLGLRDSNLADHCRRVAAYGKAMALSTGANEQDIFHIEIAAVLHDIGKIGMPDDCRGKASFAADGSDDPAYKQHPVLGQKVVDPIKELQTAATLIRHHHERFDGKGFPDGLKRDKIPFGSRLIAVVDAFDHALFPEQLSTRVGKEEAISIVKRWAGYSLDPDLVQAFCTFMEQRRKTDDVVVKVSLSDLRPGMVTARDITTRSGILLIPKNEVLTDSNIRRIESHDRSDPLCSGICIVLKEAASPVKA